MTTSSWKDLFTEGRALGAITLASGVGLQAIEGFIGATLLPSVVKDTGGLELFAWNSTVFIVGSILSAIFAAVRPFGLGPRAIYILSALTFGIGSLICALAPDMVVMLVGRAIQGLGAGLLTAMSYSMIRLMFPQVLWGSAFALISSVWGVATVIGPAIGGAFAAFDAWRLAFFVLVPCSALLGLFALRVVPRTSGEAGIAGLPLLQILLMVGAVTAMSVASVLTEEPVTPSLLVALSLALVAVMGALERRATKKLFPTGTFDPRTTVSRLLASMLLLNAAIVCDFFIPLFLQRVHGLPPVAAGYFVALVALGWSSGSMVVSNWTGSRERGVLIVGPIMLCVGLVAIASAIGGAGLFVLTSVGVGLLLLGLGIGISWPHVSARLLRAAPAGEGDLTSASISMVQLFAAGLGAAVAGVIVNAAGLAASTDHATAASAATWLYWLFALIPVATMPIIWSIASRPAPAIDGGLADPQAAAE